VPPTPADDSAAVGACHGGTSFSRAAVMRSLVTSPRSRPGDDAQPSRHAVVASCPANGTCLDLKSWTSFTLGALDEGDALGPVRRQVTVLVG
jgi:hypothetical protein